MRPYHITSNVFNSWVDLESIQMINQLIISPDAHIEAGMNGGFFTITLAFQEQPKTIQCWQTLKNTRYDQHMIPHTEQTEGEERIARWAKIREEQASLKKAYDDLLAAWKSLDPRNGST